MSYKCTFMDNDVYSAQDVNEVFSQLTSEGVVLFTDTGDALADFNAANQSLTSEGVTSNPSSCLVVLEDGVYRISEGACFMQDGSMITFFDGGHIIEPALGVLNYVYLERDEPNNRINIVLSESEPSELCVPLAKIRQDGSIVDVRRFSELKVLPSGRNVSFYGNISLSMKKDVEYTVDVGFYGFKYLLYEAGIGYSRLYAQDITDGETYAVPENNTVNGNRTCFVRFENGKLIFSQSGYTQMTVNFSFELR